MSPDPTPPPAEPAPSLRPVEEIELAELQRLHEHSTPGVWKLWAMSLLADQDGTSNVDTAVPVADFFTRDEKGRPRTWDAEFCRVAHDLTPSLLARLRAAEETLAAVGEAIGRIPRRSGTPEWSAAAFVAQAVGYDVGLAVASDAVRAALAEGASR